jgi:hypothetical protein
MFSSKPKKNSHILNIKAENIFGEKRISKPSSTRVPKNTNSNHSQSSALLHLFNNINSVVSPRNSINNFLKKTVNDYPTVLNTLTSNESRVFTLPNKNISRDNNGPVLTEPSISNTTITFGNDIRVPSKIKDKVNNLRLYSKPKNATLEFNAKIKANNKTNFSIKTIELKTSFESKLSQLNKQKNVKSLGNLNLKLKSTDKNFKDTFVINKNNNSIGLLKKKKENTKHEEYKRVCETDIFKSLEIEKPEKLFENSEENNNTNSDDALSAGEVQDIIKAFNFNEPEYKEGNLFGIKKENYFNTSLRHKYVNFLFTSVLGDK